MTKFIAAPAVALLALALGACGQQQAEYDAVCTDQFGNATDDDYCDDDSGSWYFLSHNKHKKFKHGQKVTGGSFSAPNGHAVKYSGRKKVSVYDANKQAGTPIKNNQDARKSTTVKSGGGENSFGSTSKKSSNSFKSSSSSSGRRQ
jgi:hypothetical protein